MSTKKAIVTGGSRGIGRGIVLKLAKEGYDVAFNYATASGAAEAVKKQVEELGRTCFIYQVDLSDPQSAQPFIRTACRDLGGLDLLVNNAGQTIFGHIANIPVKNVDQLINLDYKSYILNMQEAARYMVKHGTKGAIINITSSRGERAYPTDTFYGAVKAALNRSIQSIALDLAPYGIRVNNVAPGATQVRTKEEIESHFKKFMEENPTAKFDINADPFAEMASRVPLARMGTPEDIAEAVYFLASDKASYITGETLRVDGGLILSGVPERMPKAPQTTYDLNYGHSPMRNPDLRSTYLYVGSYTMPDKEGNKSEGIYVYDFDENSGRLTLIQTVDTTTNPSFITINEKNHCLYAVTEGRESSLSSYKIDTETGKLTYMNTVPCDGSAMCHVTSTADAKAAYTAMYGSGHIVAFEITADGSLGKVLNTFQHEGKGVNPRRQEHQHAHSVTISPDGKYAYACDLGMDKIMIYKIAEDGSLSPNEVPFVEVKPGEGPRHMEFHPNGKFVYLVTEMGSDVVFFTYDAETGMLTEKQLVPTLPEGYDKFNTAADIHLTADGTMLYMSNRGIDELVCFKVAEDGMLEKLASFSSVGGFPRSFALSPSNKFIAVGNQNGSLNILKRDPETGVATALSETKIPSCVCCKFVKM